MSYSGIIKHTLTLFVVILVLAGCSSSTRIERYNQPKPKVEDDTGNTRFGKHTNEISQPKDSSTYNNIADNPGDDNDDIPVEDNPIDKSKFIKNFEDLKSFNVALTPREKILFEVIKYLNTPYKYGGNSGNGIDCSAFTQQVFENSISVELPRTASEQYTIGETVGKNDLKFGDLVFFNTSKYRFPGHVGIYVGDDQFVHASKSTGVTISSLDAAYYKSRFTGARRISDDISR